MLQDLTIEWIFHFMLVFTRIGAAFSQFPGISSGHLLQRGRLIAALSISLLLLPTLQPFLPPYSNNISTIAGYLAIETLVGLLISTAAKIYFETTHFVGQIISMQSGLASASFFDPEQKSQIAIFTSLLVMASIALIFASDTHHLYINTMIASYQKFPAGEPLPADGVSHFVVQTVNDSFILGFQIASPFIVISLATLVGSGLLARLMPTLQVFFVITPAQIIIMFMSLYIVINAILSKLIAAMGQLITMGNF